MTVTTDIAAGTLVKHKGGKLYKIDPVVAHENGKWVATTRPRLLAEGYRDFDASEPKVWATQWQVNEKFPQGRPYQASRALKLKDLELV